MLGIALQSSYGTFFGTTIGTLWHVFVENDLQPGSPSSSLIVIVGGGGVGAGLYFR